jgi:hypothetical protein
MDKHKQMRQLAIGLQAASRHRDWRALQRIDTELLRLVHLWSAPNAGEAPDAKAWRTLCEAHDQARQICDEELRTLSQTLSQMAAQRDRWRAYAESSVWQLDEESAQ